MLQSLLSLLFPTRCIGCRKYGTALCGACMHSIKLADEIDTHIYAVYDYGNPLVQHAIWQLKYHRKSELVTILANRGILFITEFLGDIFHFTRKEELIFVPIPGERTRTNNRGFNQSALVAQILKVKIPGAQVSNILHKTRSTKAQARVTHKSAREKNVFHSMGASAQLSKDVIYIVIDDVTTTGATFREAMRALKSAGAKKVLCIALAHGYARGHK